MQRIEVIFLLIHATLSALVHERLLSHCSAYSLSSTFLFSTIYSHPAASDVYDFVPKDSCECALLFRVCIFSFCNQNCVLDFFVSYLFTPTLYFQIHPRHYEHISFITSNCCILFLMVFCPLPCRGHSGILCLALCPKDDLHGHVAQSPRLTSFWLCSTNRREQQKTGQEESGQVYRLLPCLLPPPTLPVLLTTGRQVHSFKAMVSFCQVAFLLWLQSHWAPITSFSSLILWA